jgi:hypothetical protein
MGENSKPMKALGMALLAGLLLASANAAEKSGAVPDRTGHKWYLSVRPDRGGNVIDLSWDRAGKKDFVTTVWPAERQARITDLDSALREASAAGFSKTPGPLKKTIGRQTFPLRSSIPRPAGFSSAEPASRKARPRPFAIS